MEHGGMGLAVLLENKADLEDDTRGLVEIRL